ncbi:MAG: hypothetical protein Q8K81_07330, partial [Sulfuricurvum sp.]|nr:hypothetical protein [Sulfuricurvum sp.]
MNRRWIGILVMIPMLHAQDMNTTTSTTFGGRNAAGMDGYGKQLYVQDVTIKTQNYKVDTFWKRFFNSDDKTTTVTELTTRATSQLSVEASSACSIAGNGELPSQGCSGQKPFLVNDEAVSGLNNGDSVSLIFQPVKEDTAGVLLYSNSNANVVYPLDIGRNGAFYQSSAVVQSGSKQTFFGFFTNIFNFFFDQLLGSSFLTTP